MNAKPTPLHPPKGVAQHDVEARRRIVETLLPHFTDTDDLLTVAEWIVTGPEEDTDA